MNIEFENSGSSVSEVLIEAFAKATDVKLPLEYKRFLAAINGGEPKRNSFELGLFAHEAVNPKVGNT